MCGGAHLARSNRGKQVPRVTLGPVRGPRIGRGGDPCDSLGSDPRRAPLRTGVRCAFRGRVPLRTAPAGGDDEDTPHEDPRLQPPAGGWTPPGACAPLALVRSRLPPSFRCVVVSATAGAHLRRMGRSGKGVPVRSAGGVGSRGLKRAAGRRGKARDHGASGPLRPRRAPLEGGWPGLGRRLGAPSSFQWFERRRLARDRAITLNEDGDRSCRHAVATEGRPFLPKGVAPRRVGPRSFALAAAPPGPRKRRSS